MTNQEFQTKLQNTISEHPIFKHDDGKLTVNELVYLLRIYFDVDYSISTNNGWCIPSVREVFIPCEMLARKVVNIVYEENEFEGEYYPTILVDLAD